jgi:hypothetical protein
MSLPQDIKAINKMLEKNHGKAFNNKPWYRIAWSEGMTEKRIGAFNDFYGEIFLRQFVGLREVRKYDGPDFRETHSIRVPMNLSGCLEEREEPTKDLTIRQLTS